MTRMLFRNYFKIIRFFNSRRLIYKNETSFKRLRFLVYGILSKQYYKPNIFTSVVNFSLHHQTNRIGYLALLAAFCYEKKKEDRMLQAAKLGNLKEIQRLAKEGVDVNHRHVFGWTALQVAAINGHSRIVEELLSLGADPNLGDNFSHVFEVSKEKGVGTLEVRAAREDEFWDHLNMRATFKNCTALHYAVLANSIEIVEILLKHGANPTVKNDAGHSPVDYAKTDEMEKLLKSYSEKADEYSITNVETNLTMKNDTGHSPVDYAKTDEIEELLKSYSEEENRGIKLLKNVGKVAVGTAIVSGVVIGGTTLALPLLGFGTLGPTAGSLAAIYQSSVLGGTIASGSAFATLQGVGMVGLSAMAKVAIVGGSAAASTATVAALNERKDRRETEERETIEAEEKERREAEERERIEAEVREKIQKEEREKIEREVIEKIEKEEREGIEREVRERIEREVRERVEKEVRDRIEKENKEKKAAVKERQINDNETEDAEKEKKEMETESETTHEEEKEKNILIKIMTKFGWLVGWLVLLASH